MTKFLALSLLFWLPQTMSATPRLLSRSKTQRHLLRYTEHQNVTRLEKTLSDKQTSLYNRLCLDRWSPWLALSLTTKSNEDIYIATQLRAEGWHEIISYLLTTERTHAQQNLARQLRLSGMTPWGCFYLSQKDPIKIDKVIKIYQDYPYELSALVLSELSNEDYQIFQEHLVLEETPLLALAKTLDTPDPIRHFNPAKQSSFKKLLRFGYSEEQARYAVENLHREDFIDKAINLAKKYTIPIEICSEIIKKSNYKDVEKIIRLHTNGWHDLETVTILNHTNQIDLMETSMKAALRFYNNSHLHDFSEHDFSRSRSLSNSLMYMASLHSEESDLIDKINSHTQMSLETATAAAIFSRSLKPSSSFSFFFHKSKSI